MVDPQSAARLAKLDEVLRHLPPDYTERGRLRNDIATLLQSVPSLTPEHGSFSGSGRTVNLFYLSGIIPITYLGNTYNIPVTIYFDPPYPRTPPRCFVTPTQGMALKSGHPNVDQGGMIYMPYLSTWGDQSSLSELMTIIASAFSAQPPVHSTAGAQQQQQPQAQRLSPGYADVVLSPQGYPMAVAKPVQATPVPQAVARTPPQLATPHELAVRALTLEAQARWPRIMEPIINDINVQSKKKAELRVQADKVEEELKRLESATLEAQTKEAELRVIEEQLRSFVEANAGQEPNPDLLKDELDPESALVLDLLAEEMAYEEFLVALDDLLEARKISMEDFLREVRDVSREQFKLRVQRQKAAKTVRAAAPGAAVPLPVPAAAAVGSSWQVVVGAAVVPVPAVAVPVPAVARAQPQRAAVPA